MISKNTEETIEYARKFAKTLKGGEVIGLIGDLGSGKTTFVKGLAEELKVADSITSPTFVILKEHTIPPRHLHLEGEKVEVEGLMVHVDAYRAETIEDIKSVGIEEYFFRDDVIVVIEWAEKIQEILPNSTIYINFEHINNNQRKITINKH